MHMELYRFSGCDQRELFALDPALRTLFQSDMREQRQKWYLSRILGACT
jgi:hypothetical protein